LAVFLRQLGATHADVDPYGIYFRCANGVDGHVTPPIPVRDFIMAFDRGGYGDLVGAAS